MSERQKTVKHTLTASQSHLLIQAYELMIAVTILHRDDCECEWCYGRMLIYCEESTPLHERSEGNVTLDQDVVERYLAAGHKPTWEEEQTDADTVR